MFEDETCVYDLNLEYSDAEKEMSYPAKEDIARKKKKVLEVLGGIGLSLTDFDAIAPRLGGMFYGGEGGTFIVEGALREHLTSKYDPDKRLPHAIYGTMRLVDELQEEYGTNLPVLTTDPTSIDQFLPEARLTGCPLFTKRAAFHALNQRATARKAAADLGKTYDTVNLIVVHAGGGVSVGAHQKGRVIDTNDSTGDGDGSFTPTRAGSVPSAPLIQLCFSGKYTESEVYRLIRKESGLQGYLGTDDLRDVEKRIENGDEYAELIFKALTYQISREIGACYATLCGNVDAIVITAGLANSNRLVNQISTRVGNIAPILRYPGGFESEALALGTYRVLLGDEKAAVYLADEEYKNMWVNA